MPPITFLCLQGFNRYDLSNIKKDFWDTHQTNFVGKLSVLKNHSQIETNAVKSDDTHMKQIVIACRFTICQRFGPTVIFQCH
jgi:hypothetical protein